ncbi:hypothetical protein JTB14_029981 [Gonioctena quinquepunctata]|nr:hypothetical protein JTB14_029981 [Gonioctena quinquepunctata]
MKRTGQGENGRKVDMKGKEKKQWIEEIHRDGMAWMDRGKDGGGMDIDKKIQKEHNGNKRKKYCLAQQENERKSKNHPLFLPLMKLLKEHLRYNNKKYASSATTETENPSSIGHFDNFPESLGENNEDSTTPVLLTNNPLSIEFSELSNNDISSKLQSIKITNISSNTPFNDKGLLSNTMEERTEHNFLSDITNNEQINFENSSSTDLGSSYPLDQSKQVNKESKNKIKWKKVKREKDLCFYCDSEVLNFARHLLRNHSSEIEITKNCFASIQ